MIIKTLLAGIFRRLFGAFREKPVRIIILNKEFIIAGKMRWGDYDDAWSLAIAMHSKVIFDVGSNIGQNALLNLCSPTVEKMVLIDANADALAVAAENIIRNNFSMKTSFVAAFASDKQHETVKFWTIGTGSAGSMYEDLAKSARDAGSSSVVPTVTLDGVASYYGVEPDYIKVDVEGAEIFVLQGSAGIASKQKALILVEMHSGPGLSMADNARKVIEWCSGNNYRPYYLAFHTWLNDPEQIAQRGRCHLLLLPGNMEVPAYLTKIKQSADISVALKDV